MQFIGHRGAKLELPENTMPGFQRAIDLNLYGIELDVHASSDRKLMVIHDPTLERTTNGSGNVSDKTSDELRSLDAGNGEKIPFLKEVTDLLKPKNMLMFLEAKDFSVAKEMVELIQQDDLYDCCVVISFDHHFVKSIKDLDAKIKTGTIVHCAPVDVKGTVKSANADFLIYDIDLLRSEVVDQAKANNIPMAVYNANNKEQLELVEKYDIEYVMSDKPTDIMNIIGERV